MDKVIKIIKKYCQFFINEQINNESQLNNIINYIHSPCMLFYSKYNIDKKLIKIVFKQLLLQTEQENIFNNFITVEERDDFFDLTKEYIVVPNDYIDIWNQYKYLFNLPQPAQRTEEWYDMRNNMITASAGAQAMNESKYDKPEDLILSKLGYGTFSENKFVHHGKKYEKIATMIYEHVYNIKIGEFGLVRHPKYSYLGASPDGICMNTTLNGIFSSMVGRMLEIKCPLTREIKKEGKEDGEICPHYYWVQVQLQLECCNLNDCDFWQCEIRESKSLDEWKVKQFNNMKYTCEQNHELKFDNQFKKGMIIQLLPKNLTIPKGDELHWYSKYIYPPHLDMNYDEYNQWAINMYKNWHTYYPDLVNDYYFDKIIYWYLDSCHNYNIKRQKEWFDKANPKLESFWNQVLYYKNNENEKNIFVQTIENKKNIKKPITEDLFSDD